MVNLIRISMSHHFFHHAPFPESLIIYHCHTHTLSLAHSLIHPINVAHPLAFRLVCLLPAYIHPSAAPFPASRPTSYPSCVSWRDALARLTSFPLPFPFLGVPWC